MSDTAQSMAVVGGLSLATTTGFMVAAALVVLIIFVFVFALYLHARRCYGANPVSGRSRSRARSVVFVTEAPQQRGLDAAAIKALPSAAFHAGEFGEGVECAVCLCELAEGEAVRLLPKCNHAFHLECIDMWFYSHSTCPLCRSPVALDNSETADPGTEPVESSPTSPADVLLSTSDAGVGDSSSPSRRREGELVIEIPGRAVEGFQASSRLPEEEETAAAASLRSLRRLLSRGSRMGGASFSPLERDIEQAMSSSREDANELINGLK